MAGANPQVRGVHSIDWRPRAAGRNKVYLQNVRAHVDALAGPPVQPRYTLRSVEETPIR